MPLVGGYALGLAEAESLHTSKDASSRTRVEKDTRLALALERIFLPFSARRKQTSTVWISLMCRNRAASAGERVKHRAEAKKQSRFQS